jgi:manganese-dependent ADP-ribose/CDP-alcohol diphosphatase
MRLLIALIFGIVFFVHKSDTNNSFSPQDITMNQKPIFSFGILADIQYADYDHMGTRYYRSSLNKLKEAVRSFKEDSVDFVINLGDMIDMDYVSYQPVIDIISSSGINTYSVSGNHDYSVAPELKSKIPVKPPSRKDYYSFIYEKFRFILLDGNEISTYKSNNKKLIKEGEKYISELQKGGDENAVYWNGGIGSNQLNWLGNELEDAKINSEKVFLICHFPILPNNIHNLLNYKQVLEVIGKYMNIIAWFNGHNHAGNYANLNNTHFVTFKGMVETETSNSFAIVAVYNNKIWIKGFGRENSKILEY